METLLCKVLICRVLVLEFVPKLEKAQNVLDCEIPKDGQMEFVFGIRARPPAAVKGAQLGIKTRS
jgi:hypothetical protein